MIHSKRHPVFLHHGILTASRKLIPSLVGEEHQQGRRVMTLLGSNALIKALSKPDGLLRKYFECLKNEKAHSKFLLVHAVVGVLHQQHMVMPA